MVDPILRQRAILEVLERKIDDLSVVGELRDGITLKLYFWDDLVKNYSDIFRSSKLNDVLLAISVVEKESSGRFKIRAIKPSTVTDQNVLGARVGIMGENGRPLDVTNLYWEIKYSEKTISQDARIASRVFWLTPRDLHSNISGKERSLKFKPNGVRYRILEWFSENEEFTKSDILAKKINTTTRTLGTEIAKLRIKAEKEFGLNEQEFIESNQGEGYKLNKKIKIKKE